MFFVVVSLIPLLTLLWWWRADRLARASRQRWARVVVAVAAVLALASISVIFSGWRATPIWAYAFVWFLIVLPATLIVMAVAGLSRGLIWAGRTIAKRPAPDREPGPSRRAILAAAAVAPPLVALGGAGVGYVRLDDFRIRRLDIPLANLPPALDGLKIVHVSDTHVGTLTRGNVLRDIVDAVNAEEADLVVHTGDLINRELRDLPEAAEMMTAMRGRLGVVCVEGNHDLMEGLEKFRRGAVERGVDLLVNERRTLRANGVELDLLGMAWPRERSDAGVEATFAALPAPRADRFTLLLAHHPHAFDSARRAGVDLTLGGHTHGGQLMLPGDVGFGPLMYRYWSGLYRDPAGRATFISNGVGNWFPLRTFAPAEIGVLTLRAAPPSA